MNLENLGKRDMIWFHHKLKLRYETTADQLRYLLAEIREVLYRHPKVESSSARVRLIGFGDSSLDWKFSPMCWKPITRISLPFKRTFSCASWTS